MSRCHDGPRKTACHELLRLRIRWTRFGSDNVVVVARASGAVSRAITGTATAQKSAALRLGQSNCGRQGPSTGRVAKRSETRRTDRPRGELGSASRKSRIKVQRQPGRAYHLACLGACLAAAQRALLTAYPELEQEALCAETPLQLSGSGWIADAIVTQNSALSASISRYRCEFERARLARLHRQPF